MEHVKAVGRNSLVLSLMFSIVTFICAIALLLIFLFNYQIISGQTTDPYGKSVTLDTNVILNWIMGDDDQRSLKFFIAIFVLPLVATVLALISIIVSSCFYHAFRSKNDNSCMRKSLISTIVLCLISLILTAASAIYHNGFSGLDTLYKGFDETKNHDQWYLYWQWSVLYHNAVKLESFGFIAPIAVIVVCIFCSAPVFRTAGHVSEINQGDALQGNNQDGEAVIVDTPYAKKNDALSALMENDVKDQMSFDEADAMATKAAASGDRFEPLYVLNPLLSHQHPVNEYSAPSRIQFQKDYALVEMYRNIECSNEETLMLDLFKEYFTAKNYYGLDLLMNMFYENSLKYPEMANAIKEAIVSKMEGRFIADSQKDQFINKIKPSINSLINTDQMKFAAVIRKWIKMINDKLSAL